jgi:hypothetical protein
MIVLAFYTMRRRGLSLGDILKQNKDQGARGGSSVSASSYDWDRKQRLDDDYSSMRKEPVYPPPAVAHTRLGSLSSQSTLQTLDRSDRYVPHPSHHLQPANATQLQASRIGAN